jgi:sporulation protein YlmC with PRC-barrel domain
MTSSSRRLPLLAPRSALPALLGCAVIMAAPAALMTAHAASPGRGPDDARALGATGPELQADARSMSCKSARHMTTCKVVNPNAESIASVADAVLDRGTGRIEHLLISTGTTLGMGGRTVAVPMSAFRPDPASADRLVLAVTPEQLKGYPVYEPSDFADTIAPGPRADSPLHTRLAQDSAGASDPYAGSIGADKAVRLQGRVSGVARVTSSTFGEQVEVTIVTQDGAAHRVALGPSWFVNHSAAAPMRGEQATIMALPLAHDPEGKHVATEFSTGAHSVVLRAGDGRPQWLVGPGADAPAPARLRYVLLSALRAMAVDCRGQECGRVDDLLIDARTGDALFLSIDPDQNFMGIRDTKRLIPWPIAAVGERRTVRLDASKAMVLASVKTPADLGSLEAVEDFKRAYTTFELTPPSPRAAADGAGTLAGCWGAKGAVLAGLRPTTRASVAGIITDIIRVPLGVQHGDARALVLRPQAEPSAARVVLLGPWGDTPVPMGLRAGQFVGIDVVQSSIDGQDHWITRVVERSPSRTVLVGENDTPEWSSR